MSNNTTKSKKVEGYGDDDISSLDNISHIRLRYGMYMGKDPANHSVNEILDNVYDEYANGHGMSCDIVFNQDLNEFTVQDRGRGIPVGINTKTKRPTLQMVFQDANTGGKFGQSEAFKSGAAGLNGTGGKGVNALSEYFRAESERDGKRVAIEFSKGRVTKEFHEIKPLGFNGVKVSFRPDSELLQDHDLYKLDLDKILTTCKTRAYLNKGFKFNLTVISKGKETKYTFFYENGIFDYLDEIASNKLFNMNPVAFERKVNGRKKSGISRTEVDYVNSYEIAFVYDASSSNEDIQSFANGIRNSKGTHEAGFKFALTNIVNKYITDNNLLPKKNANLKITGDDIRKGMICIINTKVTECLFTGQTKDELGNPEVRTDVINAMNEGMNEWIANNEAVFKKICNRIIQLAVATENVKKLQDKIVKVSSASSGLSFSDKYTSCVSDDPKIKELFICEGKSASGSLKVGRDSNYQAIYALKGKPLNTIGKTMSSMLNNFECNELMKIIFGTNDIKSIDYDKINFHNIVFAADADVDGSHIIALLAAMFKEHFTELLIRGYIKIACPPLYRITVKGKYVYFKNNKEFLSYKVKHISQRYKVATEGLTIAKLLEKAEDFKQAFNLIKNRYSLTDDILSMLLSAGTDATAEYLDEQGLEVTVDENNIYYVQGLLEDSWLDVEITDELMVSVMNLKTFYGTDTLSIADCKEEVVYDCDIIDGLNLIEEEFTFKPYRFKGLGETNPSELRETTMNPLTRDIINISLDTNDIEEATKITETLFGNNTDVRKDIIQEKLC